jgi:molybdate transport system substrate-binding protein
MRHLMPALIRMAAVTLVLLPVLAFPQPRPTVAAASDLKFALEEIAKEFERDTGQRVTLVFGSSGNVTSQILNGAPFEMFLSADESYVARLHQAGKTRGTGRLYAMGRIGLFVPKGSPLRADASLADLGRAARDGRLRRFAIANPEHAPYGARAREALRHAGVWQVVAPRLVVGENVSQAAQFAASGSAQGGIIALSLARAPEFARRGRFVLLPEAWHRPLRQRMVLMKHAGPQARAFHDYLTRPKAQAVLRRHGFAVPRGAR